MWGRIHSPVRRVAYYGGAIGREIVPRSYWQVRRRARFARLVEVGIPAEIVERVNYYNKLSAPVDIGDAPRLREISRKQSYYYYDLRRFVLSFDPDLRLAYAFGDITEIPAVPAVVKSRPVAGANGNSVVMKLNRLRHYSWPRDRLSFEEKAPRAVWRGSPHNEMRKSLVRLYSHNPRFDIGHVGDPFEGFAPKPWLDMEQQLGNRYIVSLEGRDVATNLKWISASNSLCLMPRPRYETWFMEGTLVPGVHYAELREDLSDLEEKVDHLERHPEDARRIIANAHAHVARFADEEDEALISLLVLQKYLERTGQCEPGPLSHLVFP